MAAPDESFAHEGIKPQRMSDNSRRGPFGFCRITGTGWVGAMLYRRSPVVSVVGRSIEVLLDKLFPPRQSVASAHHLIIADRERTPGECSTG